MGRVVGELDGLVDRLLGLLVELLDVLVGHQPVLGHPLAEVVDRVALAPLLDLLLGAVLLGVGHGVAAVAVGHRLHQLRLALLARALERLAHHRVGVEHVHAVALRAGHAEALRLPRQVGHRRVALQRGAHAELVVDDQEDDRQAPQRSQVHGLAEGALVGGAVAGHGEDDVLGLVVVGRQRDAGRQRQRAAHDPVAAEEAPVPVEEVHGAAAAARAAVHAAEQLGHDLAGRHPAGDGLAVLAVGGHQVVLVAERLGGADDGRLLADAQVQEAADLRLRVHLAGALLEAPDQQHLLEDQPTGVLVGEVVFGTVDACLIGRPCAGGLLRSHLSRRLPAGASRYAAGARPQPPAPRAAGAHSGPAPPACA